MADFFQVEVGTLAQYVTTLKDAQQRLAELPKLLSSGSTDLGNDKLNDAAGDFQHSWAYGAGQLGELVTETTDAVSEIATVYSQVDDQIGKAVKTLGEPLRYVGQAADGMVR
ncbi:hypothetical protein [Actinoplanes sp. N902-109]|uniref:hypothetical protein n=1 Tax=Actinoplanes sp. (strain N902-109) TaxID=649831 RepID=UPI0003296024|nr:hypothetical protein [Actinoplanes sp. N902-109]AGL18954.1 hypothetical protein L083_5444 [Actinoplanes sp. N902-109]